MTLAGESRPPTDDEGDAQKPKTENHEKNESKKWLKLKTWKKMVDKPPFRDFSLLEEKHGGTNPTLARPKSLKPLQLKSISGGTRQSRSRKLSVHATGLDSAMAIWPRRQKPCDETGENKSLQLTEACSSKKGKVSKLIQVYVAHLG